MTTAWEVRGGQNKVRLDADGHGEVTFTVTNPSEEQDRAVFEVVPLDAGGATTTARPNWFEVEEPERLVLPGWTAAYLVRIAIPPEVAADRYQLVGRARSADDDETRAANWVTSEPVLVRAGKRGSGGVPGSSGSSGSKVAGFGGRRPLLIALIVTLAVLLLAGIGLGVWFLLRSGPVEMPSLSGYSESSARRELTERGLKLGTVRHRHDPDANTGEIRAQRPAAGTEVAEGDTVDLEIAVHLDAPTPVAPADGEDVPGRQFPHLEWSGVAEAEGYRVTVERQWCVRTIGGKDCSWIRDRVDITGTTSARPTLPKDNEDAYSGRVRWRVAALDDFGGTGPTSPTFAFTRR